MKTKYYFLNEQKKVPVNAELKVLLKTCCESVLKRFAVSDACEISITFVDNPVIREINRENREIDRETDVLSFPMNEAKDGMLQEPVERDEDGRILLGDIVLSLEKAKSQADEYGHSFQREVAFLCVHSMLHLIGFDHMVPEEEKNMFAIQESILQELGITRG